MKEIYTLWVNECVVQYEYTVKLAHALALTILTHTDGFDISYFIANLEVMLILFQKWMTLINWQ